MIDRLIPFSKSLSIKSSPILPRYANKTAKGIAVMRETKMNPLLGKQSAPESSDNTSFGA